MASTEGTGIGELMCITGMSRPTLYRHLTQHVKAGRAVQVGCRWRATTTQEPHGE
jgi:predicted DNA-binding transcriptional regulator AlpA